VFQVRLSAPSGREVRVDYATTDATAVAGSDYLAASGTLSFAEGETQREVAVQVAGDTFVEPDEAFLLELSNPFNAALGDAQGVGTIGNGDCGIVLTPASHAVDAAGGLGSFRVDTSDFCAWRAKAPAGLALLGGGSGVGPGLVYYSVAPNAGRTPRALRIDVEGHVHLVEQAASPRVRPATPALVAPAGTIRGTSPTYAWTAVPGATRYQIQVSGPDGASLLKAAVDAREACAGARCLVAPGGALVAGSHTWKARASNAFGVSPWSVGLRFHVIEESEGAPAVSTPVSPSGRLTVASPTYAWMAAAGSTGYELVVEGPRGIVLRATYKAVDACTGLACAVTPATPLRDGSHTFKVRGRNAKGFSAWSVAQGFTVLAGSDALPARAVPASPVRGTVAAPPTFTWLALRDATGYVLSIATATGAIERELDAARACVAARCAFTLPEAGPGEYTWTVRGLNEHGSGPASVVSRFKLGSETQPAPAAPVAHQPGAVVNQTRPTYAWSEVPGASDYLVWVDAPAGNALKTWYAAALVCTAGQCAVSPAVALAPGDHELRLQARSASVLGPWSEALPFSVEPGVEPPPGVDLVAPSGEAGARPGYVWTAAAGATRYRLWVEGPSGVVLDASLDASDVCVDDFCTSIPETVLDSGPHTFWVQPANDGGQGPWSAPLGFSVGLEAVPPGAPAPVGPTGLVGDTSPTFVWAAASRATGYLLQVHRGEERVLDLALAAADACRSGGCAVTPPATLEEGDYAWSVKARNEAGEGPWSPSLGFTVAQ
jgi:hypothetical protein